MSLAESKMRVLKDTIEEILSHVEINAYRGEFQSPIAEPCVFVRSSNEQCILTDEDFEIGEPPKLTREATVVSPTLIRPIASPPKLTREATVVSPILIRPIASPPKTPPQMIRATVPPKIERS